MMIGCRARSGVTILELIAVIALLGLMLALTGLASGGAAPPESVPEHSARVSAARRQSLEQRRPVSLTVHVNGRALSVTALPDGRLLADTALEIDALMGEAHVR